ncbi:diguanylate cyclase [Paraliobacillus sp. JSM ZJ581]|uniref:diguanylate cyclase n=1 Tax=Paraliobacillus sp. JSM ZJ581 TaxID=3342118 RepID=UPI0035A93CE9
MSKIKLIDLYTFSIHVAGFILFFMYGTLSFDLLNNWLLAFAMIGVAILLIKYNIQVPPYNNSIALDSIIYLGGMFVFGLEMTLGILFYTNMINAFVDRKTKKRVHLFNFNMYILILTVANAMLVISSDQLSVNEYIPYFLSLITYFIANTLLIGVYFWLVKQGKLLNALKSLMKGTVESYASTMLLSIVLSFMLAREPYLGLATVALLSMLLSHAFKRHYNLYQSIKNKATRDHLTGLYNHGYFKEKLNNYFEEKVNWDKPMSLVMLDVDDFKIFNDTNGHMQGDKVLEIFGKKLAGFCKDKQYTVARYGGEEFVILMPNTNETEAARLMEQFRIDINRTYIDGVEKLPQGCLSFSAGVSEWKQPMNESSELLSYADQAMYDAKKQGKNNIRIYRQGCAPLLHADSLDDLEQQLKVTIPKDIYTYRHSKRVFKLAIEFGNFLNLSERDRSVLILGALIHDIGKVEIPRKIIRKIGKLTQAEWELVKQHVTWGKDIVAIDSRNQAVLPLVEFHHERYDGKGYPRGLVGQHIPKLARILSVIDSFDAMTTERPYQKMKTYKEAIIELEACAGTQFDPYYVNSFVEYLERNDIIFQQEK